MIDEPASTVHTAACRRARLLLLLFVLLAFARLVYGLGAQNLWLDEAFSLQRAESAWPALIAGALPLTDGVRTVDTTDQHPFAYFVLLGLMLRAAGISEFALRFPAVIAATLLVPVVWTLARRLTRSRVLPRSAPIWVALLVAINPFYLWFGQEVRMYAQVALLAPVSTYLLLRWADAAAGRRRRLALIGYVVAICLLLSTHYFAVLILPAHAAVVFQTLGRQRPRRAVLATAILFALALLPAGLALALFARDPNAGTNWAQISPRILAADLLNAFSMGPNVDIRHVWGFDLFSGALAMLGVIYGLDRSRSARPWRGWLLPALVLVPPALLLIVSAFRPAYMTARHMSLISGFFLLLVAGGVAWLWQTRRWLGGLAAVVLVAGAAYAMTDYHLKPRHGGGDLAGMGQYLRERVQPGDLLLTKPILWGRLYQYYLPTDVLKDGGAASPPSAWRGLPLLRGWEETVEELQKLRDSHRRIWLVRSVGPDEDGEWLFAHMFRVEHQAFESTRAALDVDLLLAQSPVLKQPPATIQYGVDAVFGGEARLLGYDLGQALAPDGAIPVTLYWQPVSQISRRYKYILRLIAADGEALSTTEREPYNGALPTTAWPLGSTIMEYTEIPPPARQQWDKSRLVLQMYDAETLEKLPVTGVSGAAAGQGVHTVVLPAAPPAP
ncbi:MAG: glycosyltransferase family 39 protein [Anaerolineae bacterium]|jgi:4-amino-4-deoxy-L-arabinose transferase-like glycosyltransferase|nr:glycosyltransferase family 39 protein [Anaerolineae bacterium]